MTRAVDHAPALSDERAAEDCCTPCAARTGASCCPTRSSTTSPTWPRTTPSSTPRWSQLARGVALLDGSDDAAAPGIAVVVATGASVGAAPALAALTRPGGWVYVETTGRASRRWARALRRAGPRGGRRRLAVAERRRAA